MNTQKKTPKPVVPYAECGWSLMGHYYVEIETGYWPKGGHAYLACTSKTQARAICHALGGVDKIGGAK